MSHAHGDNPLVALTNGFQAALATAIVFPALGLLIAIALLGRLKVRVPPLIREPAAAQTE